MNVATDLGSPLASARNAQDIAFTIMSSRSSMSTLQTANVRCVFSVVPLTLRRVVQTSAARRHQRSFECAHSVTSASVIWLARQADRQLSPQNNRLHPMYSSPRRLHRGHDGQCAHRTVVIGDQFITEEAVYNSGVPQFGCENRD
jgi:hypothetical protein